MTKNSLLARFEAAKRRVRVMFGGETIADSTQVMLLRESDYEINYYFPEAHVQQQYLTPSTHTEHSGYKGDSVFWNVRVGDNVAENAAWAYPNAKENRPDLQGYVAFKWDAMEHWYEEDEEVFGHPRDPYHRVDTIASSRHIRVVMDGETVADSHHPVMLIETGLPVRYYLPQVDVRMDLLTPNDTQTICPYKGFASYWSVNTNGQEHQDFVWGYLNPLVESTKIKDLVSFYNEKVDIYVDGQLEEKPRTNWS